MNIIVGDRRTGKTTKAVAWLKEADNRALIVATQRWKKTICHKFGLYDFYRKKSVEAHTDKLLAQGCPREEALRAASAKSYLIIPPVYTWSGEDLREMQIYMGGKRPELFIDNAGIFLREHFARFGRLEGISINEKEAIRCL